MALLEDRGLVPFGAQKIGRAQTLAFVEREGAWKKCKRCVAPPPARCG